MKVTLAPAQILGLEVPILMDGVSGRVTVTGMVLLETVAGVAQTALLVSSQ